jgi:hypothetical protein
MTDGQKTIVVAAFLAAAAGVYLEMSRHEELDGHARHPLSTPGAPSSAHDSVAPKPHR